MFYGLIAAGLILVIYVLTLVSRERRLRQQMDAPAAHDRRQRKEIADESPHLLGLGAAGAAYRAGSSPRRRQSRAPRAPLPSPKIKDVQVIATAPVGLRLVVVKIVTDQDGLYGYGCGTFTQRADLVVAAVEKYLKPFLIGKPADRIDDTLAGHVQSARTGATARC